MLSGATHYTEGIGKIIDTKKLVACVGGYAFLKGHDTFNRKKKSQDGISDTLRLEQHGVHLPCITLTFGTVLSGEVVTWPGGLATCL